MMWALQSVLLHSKTKTKTRRSELGLGFVIRVSDHVTGFNDFVGLLQFAVAFSRMTCQNSNKFTTTIELQPACMTL